MSVTYQGLDVDTEMADFNQTRPKAVIVTGASTGLGLEMARSLAEQGQTEVVTIQRRSSPLESERVHSYCCDLYDEQAIGDVCAEVCERFQVVGLVNNAGSGGSNPLETVTWEQIDALNRLHVRASLLMMQGVVPQMKSAGYGRVVNIGSRAQLGKEGRTAYASSKAALLASTRVWALELGPHGITVNMVAPGPINIGLFAKHTPPGSERAQRLNAAIPVRRIGEPDDVVHAVNFFLSPHAGYVTGQVLYVCGGMSVAATSI